MKKIFSLFAAAVMAVSAMAVDIATGTFDGKAGSHTTGWTTTGTGVSRNDCVIVGSGENITSPAFDFSGYSSVTIEVKARRYGTLSGSKAVIDVTPVGGSSLGTFEATSTTASNSAGTITFTPTSSMTNVVLVFTCTNATSAGSTHGAGINSVIITGEQAGPSTFEGTVTSSVETVSSAADLEGIVLTFVGATTIAEVDEEDFGGIYFQNETGSELYAIWHPTLGGAYTVNGNAVTLTGWSTDSEYGCEAFPEESATLYLSDMGSFLADDYDDYFEDVEVAYEVAYDCPTAAVLSVAEAIAAADHACIATNDSISVTGWITKMEFRPSNFTRYGSVNIYVTDAEGNEFEFYNCYSLNADTFQTVLPEVEDWTSTAWTQAAYIIDRHGNQINRGDSVVARGKYTKYNSTYELNTGCYLTYAPERLAPAAATFEDVEIGEGDYVYRPAAWETGDHAWTSGSWTLNTTVASWGGFTDIQVVNTLDTADTEGYDHYLVAAAAVVAEGNNYAVWNDNYGANAMVVNKAEASVVSGMAITNTYDAVESMKHGDAYAAGLKNEGDFFKLTVYGYAYNAENELVAVNTTVEFMLGEVKNGELVFAENWQWLDLSSLGEISAISFALTGSDTSSYGFLNTPGYFCFDNLGGAAEDCELGVMSSFTPTALDAVESVKAVKFIENGQLIIVKDGVRYNALGARL